MTGCHGPHACLSYISAATVKPLIYGCLSLVTYPPIPSNRWALAIYSGREKSQTNEVQQTRGNHGEVGCDYNLLVAGENGDPVAVVHQVWPNHVSEINQAALGPHLILITFFPLQYVWTALAIVRRHDGTAYIYMITVVCRVPRDLRLLTV